MNQKCADDVVQCAKHALRFAVLADVYGQEVRSRMPRPAKKAVVAL